MKMSVQLYKELNRARRSELGSKKAKQEKRMTVHNGNSV